MKTDSPHLFAFEQGQLIDQHAQQIAWFLSTERWPTQNARDSYSKMGSGIKELER